MVRMAWMAWEEMDGTGGEGDGDEWHESIKTGAG